MHRLLLMYTMDPRGAKVGGIETHIRQILQHHPDDFSVLFVGTDETGDLTPGKVYRQSLGGRSFDFMPVAQVRPEAVNTAAKRLVQSTTLRYVLGALRHLGAIRRALGPGPATADLHRFEFAPIARLLGLPALQMIHGEGSKNDRMDSLIKTYWYIHSSGERLALRLARGIYCVNPAIVERLKTSFPHAYPKAELLSVSVDTGLFRPTPFDCADDTLRLVFAGRLDEFKDPPLLFRTVAELRRILGRVELHYVGATDPERYAEFASVRDVTVRHGFQNAQGVAGIMARCHMGVLTSFFEGMPCFLLEGLAAGRPFGAIRLPQYDPLIVSGVSGALVERRDTPEASADALAAAFAEVWSAIKAGRITPEAVAAKAAPFAITSQMSRLFARHRGLHARGPAGASKVAAA